MNVVAIMVSWNLKERVLGQQEAISRVAEMPQTQWPELRRREQGEAKRGQPFQITVRFQLS